LVFLGDDEHGVALEVVAVVSDTGVMRVIHAMKLCPKYRTQHEEALPWRNVSSS